MNCRVLFGRIAGNAFPAPPSSARPEIGLSPSHLMCDPAQMDSTQIVLGDITVDVVRKRVKNINLTVHPPLGRVRISAPKRASLKTIREFAISKLDWIRQHQARMREQARQAPPGKPRRELKYLDGESHVVWGMPCRLAVSERDGPPSIELNRDHCGSRSGRARTGTDVETWSKTGIGSRSRPRCLRCSSAGSHG